jgi:hypothetical protein
MHPYRRDLSNFAQFHFGVEDTSPCKGHITVVGDQTGFLMFVRWVALAAFNRLVGA